MIAANRELGAWSKNGWTRAGEFLVLSVLFLAVIVQCAVGQAQWAALTGAFFLTLLCLAFRLSIPATVTAGFASILIGVALSQLDRGPVRSWIALSSAVGCAGVCQVKLGPRGDTSPLLDRIFPCRIIIRDYFQQRMTMEDHLHRLYAALTSRLKQQENLAKLDAKDVLARGVMKIFRFQCELITSDPGYPPFRRAAFEEVDLEPALSVLAELLTDDRIDEPTRELIHDVQRQAEPFRASQQAVSAALARPSVP